MKVRKFNILIVYVVLLCAGMLSCTDELRPPNRKDTGHVVTFSVRVTGLRAPKTYALKPADECEIRSIEILLFDLDSKNFVHEPVYCEDIVPDPLDPDLLTFSVPLPYGRFEAAFFANAKAYIEPVKHSFSGLSKTLVLNKIMVAHSGKWITDKHAPDYKPIPFWGEMKNLIFTTQAQTEIPPITMIRMLAKIDVELTTAAARSKFKLSEVRLYNRYNKGTIAPNLLYWNNTDKKVSDPTIPTEANKIWSPLIYDSDEITDTDIACKNKIYTFETDWGSEDTPNANSYLIIGGYYEDDELPCYYRADLTSSGESSKLYYALLRNHHYRVNIKDVPERGLETTEEAEGMLNCNIDIEVIPWDESNEIDVGFSGIQHHFSVSAHNFLFNEIGRTEDDTDNILMISTDYPEGWYVEKITNSKNQIVDWISFTQSSGSAGDNAEVKLLVSEAFHDRIAYVFLKADRFTYVVKVTQITPPQSNCYLVATNSSIAIPVFRVNQSQLGKQLGIDDTFDAELVWTDNANRISAASNIKSISTSGVGYTGHIIVETGSAEGNAVVAIKKNGVILWSWHVWVANYEPDVDAHGFMTRNLGALSQTPGELSAQGLLYQWGRKDPFPGSANWNQEVEPVIYSALGQTSVQKVQTPENANFGNSVKNPLTFYYTNTADDVNSWYQWESISSDTLWGQSMVKSVYDPSPPGWRVASGAQLSNLVTLGYEYDVPNWGLFISAGGGWFPSVICRGGSHGNLQWFGGPTSAYWASCRKDAYNCLLMSPSSVVMSSYSYSYAYAVRCVREEDYYDY